MINKNFNLKKGMYMKKNILLLATFVAIFMLPKTVFAANTFDVYTVTNLYGIAADPAPANLDAAVTLAEAGGVCVGDLSKTTLDTCGDSWAPGVIVISGDDLELTDLDADVVILVNGLDLTITETVNVIGAGTIDGSIIVTGNGKAIVGAATYPNYIGNANTFSLDTSETGSSVKFQTLDFEGTAYSSGGTNTVGTLLRDSLGLAGSKEVWTGITINGKVYARENLGLLEKDTLLIEDNAELVIPEGKNIDSRNLITISELGKLTISDGATLYNVGSIAANGTIDGNGNIENGTRHTAGAPIEVGIGEIRVLGTLNVNKSLKNVTGTSVDVLGTVNVGVSGAITNPGNIVLQNDGKLVNNTSSNITVKKLVAGSVDPVDHVIEGIKTNPKTFDFINVYVLFTLISLISLSLLTKKKKSF